MSCVSAMDCSLGEFMSFYLVVYLLGYFVVFRRWDPRGRLEASSCLLSIFHGGPVVVMSFMAIFSDTTRSFSAPNTPFQNAVLSYSVSYFLADLLHCVVFFPSEVIFIAHHLATLFVLSSCRFLVGRAAFGILGLLIVGEITSPCQNALTFANTFRHLPGASFSPKLYRLLSPPFFVIYFLVRGVVGPFLMLKMSYFYFLGGAAGVIPSWLWVSWAVVVLSALGVSVLWVWNQAVEFVRERNEKIK